MQKASTYSNKEFQIIPNLNQTLIEKQDAQWDAKQIIKVNVG